MALALTIGVGPSENLKSCCLRTSLKLFNKKKDTAGIFDDDDDHDDDGTWKIWEASKSPSVDVVQLKKCGGAIHLLVRIIMMLLLMMMMTMKTSMMMKAVACLSVMPSFFLISSVKRALCHRRIIDLRIFCSGVVLMVSGSLGCEGFGVGGKAMMVSSVVLVTYITLCIILI